MESNLLSISQQFSGLPMDSLIGGPLNAAAEANAKMAMTQTMFLLDTCYVNEGKNEEATYKPIMIKMELTRPFIESDEKIQNAKVSINLPTMTTIAINTLAIDSVDIKFDMDVRSSFAEESSRER